MAAPIRNRRAEAAKLANALNSTGGALYLTMLRNSSNLGSTAS